MSEPSSVVTVSHNPIRAKYGERGKTMAQLSSQIDRLFNAAQQAMEGATGEERRRIRNRYLKAGDIYSRYYDNMSSSPRMNAAIRSYAKTTGTLKGIDSYAPNVVIPRSQYMKRKNNRRG